MQKESQVSPAQSVDQTLCESSLESAHPPAAESPTVKNEAARPTGPSADRITVLARSVAPPPTQPASYLEQALMTVDESDSLTVPAAEGSGVRTQMPAGQQTAAPPNSQMDQTLVPA